jgi:hypothetical protein
MVFLKPVNKNENKDGIGVTLKTDILYEVAFGNLAGGGIITIDLSRYLPNWFRRGGLGSRARSQNVLLLQAGEFLPCITRPAEKNILLAPKLLAENLFLEIKSNKTWPRRIASSLSVPPQQFRGVPRSLG